MTLLGKIPAAPKPINLPSQRCNLIGSQLIVSLTNIFFIYTMNVTVVGWRIKDMSHMWRGMYVLFSIALSGAEKSVMQVNFYEILKVGQKIGACFLHFSKMLNIAGEHSVGGVLLDS